MTLEKAQADGCKAPRLLVSVRDAGEAADAMAGGADWIDLKEPHHGPLGAVSATIAHEATTIVGDRAPLSAAAGELVDWPEAASRELLTIAGISIIKLGLAGCRRRAWQSRWRDAQAEVAAAGKQLVAVAYADHHSAAAPPPAEVLDLAADAACPWILMDTFDKRDGPLGDHLSPTELAAWLAGARAAACGTAVAGRLDDAAIRQLPMELIDVVAVRGAACTGPRTARVSRQRVAELVQLLSSALPPRTREVGVSAI